MKKVRKFIYKNLFWLRSIAIAFLFGLASSLFIESPRPVDLFIGGATLVIAVAGSFYYFNLWKVHRYHNGGDLIWYSVVLGVWTAFSAGKYVAVVLPSVFDHIPRSEQILDILWFSTAIVVFLIPHIVFRSWKSVDYWVGEFIKDVRIHLISRQSEDKQLAVDSTQRILHELYAIRNKDPKLKALVPLLEHEHDGVRAWAARFLLEYGDIEEKAVEVLGVLAKKEGYVGEASQKVLHQWSERKTRIAEQDALYENTPLITRVIRAVSPQGGETIHSDVIP